MNFMDCDGCGHHISEGYRPLVEVRLRLLRYEADADRRSNAYVGPTPNGAWDFCSIGCVATWATQQEFEPGGHRD